MDDIKELILKFAGITGTYPRNWHYIYVNGELYDYVPSNKKFQIHPQYLKKFSLLQLKQL